jgi:starch synthase
VLNGIDYEVWNPGIDILIRSNYTAGAIVRKYANKDALRDRLLLRKEYEPVIAYVGRIDRQKGSHLIEHAIFYALAQGAQFVLLGACPDPAVNARFWYLKHYLNDNPTATRRSGFDEGLAHLRYAAADMLVMPSQIEPCGLSQLIALKYGTVPVVRAIGGLVDTVFDRHYSACHPDDRNGYVFHQPDSPALESVMARAIGVWYSCRKSSAG